MSIKSELKRLMKSVSNQSDKNIKKLEIEIIKQYKIALDKMKLELSKYYEHNYSTQRLNAMIEKITKILKDAGVKGLENIDGGIKKNFKYNFEATTQAFGKSLGTDLSFAVLNPDKVNASVINKYSKINWKTKGISNVNDATRIVRNEVTQGIINGKNYEVVAKKITNQLNISVSDALRITRTESHRATSEARLLSLEDSKEAAKELGFKPISIWNCSFHNSREQHIDMDGTEADENGIFTFPDGTTTEAPGLSGAPEHDVNCLCDISFDIKDL